MKKRIAMTAAAAMMLAAFTSAPAFAGQWQSDAAGWWWQNDDGSYPANCWQWLDGNQDGIAECYYFDGTGYMLADTITPDGYQVDGNGAWTVNGAVQTQAAQTSQASQIRTVMNRYQQADYQAYVNVEGAADTGDSYEIQALLCVPVTFTSDPLAGKKEGDILSYSVSDLTGKTAEAKIAEESWLGGRELVAYGDWDYRSSYSDPSYGGDGKWHLVGSSDWEPAKEIYNGTLKLRKDAQVRILKDWISFDHITISAEDLISQTGEYGNRWVADEMNIDGKAYYCNYTLKLNSAGEIVEMEQNWHT